MLKIAVFTRPLDDWTSGSGHHLNEILSHALDINDRERRFDFTFIHYRRSENPIYRRVRELIVPRFPVAAGFALRRESFDAVHYSPLTIYSPIWFLKGKRIATLHGADQLQNPHLYGFLEIAHERLVVPAYARRMDGIVTVSETSRNYFRDHWRIDPRRVEVCYNGMNSAYRTLPARELSAPQRFGTEGPYVLHVSRFSERKNPWTLFKAFARFRESRAEAAAYRLVCAGRDWNSPLVLRRAGELGIADSYTAPGFVSEEDVVELMNGARAFLFPSLAEGFGMPNVEAMACSCPVVTTGSFAIPEIVGDAGIILDDPLDDEAMAEALARACFDEVARARLIAAGLERIKRFSWEESAGRMLDLYEWVAGKARGYA